MHSISLQRKSVVQFMPQDRVAEFARLKPFELLEETERAIGDGKLHQLHHDLITDRKDFVSKETVSFHTETLH